MFLGLRKAKTGKTGGSRVKFLFDGIPPLKPRHSYLNVKISLGLHKSLAMFSAKNNKTVNETIEEALANYITV